jgi:hypothetical protein
VGEALDLLLIVGGDRLPLRIEERRAVLLQLDRADRKELQHFARVVFVGLDTGGRVRFDVVDHVEVVTHRGRQRHLSQHVLEIVEREVGQGLLVALHRIRLVDVGPRRDQNLG